MSGYKIKERIGKLNWADLALVLVAIFYLHLHSDLVSQFKQLPSPLYGGDIYHQLGSINNIVYGGSPVGSSNLDEGGPTYFITYPYLVAAFSKIFGLDPMNAMFYVSGITLLFSLFLTYTFLYCLFHKKPVALIGTLLYIQLDQFPVLKYTNFTEMLVFPAFLLALLYFFRTKRALSSVLLGVTYGILSISHGLGILIGTSTFLAVSAYLLVLQYFKRNGPGPSLDLAGLKKGFSRNAQLLCIPLAIGFSIALLYWYEPIFKYHLNTSSTLHYSSGADFWDPSVQANFVGSTLRGLFFSDWVSVLRVLGLVLLLVVRKYADGMKFTIIVFGTFLLLVYHFYITIPLLNTHFLPNHMLFFGALPFLLPALFSLCVLAEIRQLKKYSAFIFLLLAAYIAYSQNSAWDAKIKEDRWVQVGFTEQQPNILALQDWVVSNTGVNDVFLSSNELSFALNAVTGRKIVTNRKAHNSPFVDMDARAADAAIILYGNNTILREKLLKRYNVKYLYWDYYWIHSEYSFDDKGRLVNTFDPLVVFEKPYYHNYFAENNVTYFKMHTWPDPAGRDESVRKYDLLFVVPNQWNWQHPWSNGLDPYLREVWNYTQGGQVISKIYAVRV